MMHWIKHITLFLEKYKSDDYTSGTSSSNLAAALIDSHRNRSTKGNINYTNQLLLLNYSNILIY